MGVDVGVKALAVVFTGEVVPNPKHLSRYARRIARFQAQRSRRPGQGAAAVWALAALGGLSRRCSRQAGPGANRRSVQADRQPG